MDIINILNTIENSTLLSTLAGAVVGSITGGVITWWVTSSSLNKQLKYQKEIMDLEEAKKEKMVLINLRREISDNLTKLDIIKKIYGEAEDDIDIDIDLEKNNKKDLLKEDYWKQYGYMLGYMNNITFKNELLEFYNFIDIFKTFGGATVKHINIIIKEGDELIYMIDELLNEYND